MCHEFGLREYAADAATNTRHVLDQSRPCFERSGLLDLEEAPEEAIYKPGPEIYRPGPRIFSDSEAFGPAIRPGEQIRGPGLWVSGSEL